MSKAPTYLRGARAVIAMGLVFSCVVGCKKPAHAVAPPKPAAGTNAPSVTSTNDSAAAYVSVFEDLPPPKGKDPFFPKSRRRETAPIQETTGAGAAKGPVAAVLVLKGVVGSSARRMAVINNEVMGVGETSLVRVPDGQVRVQCLKIGTDYVLVKVEGEDQPKRLDLGK